MRASVASALLVAGCSFQGVGAHDGPGPLDGPQFDGAITDGPSDGPPSDAAADASPDASPCESWHPHHVDGCALPPAGAGWTVGAGTHTYDSDADSYDGAPLADVIGPGHTAIASVDGVSVRVISVDDFTVLVGGTLNVVGDRPVFVASWNDLRVAGTVDASSLRGGRTGAGANAAACEAASALAGQIAVSSGGSGGGGGGAYGGDGGPGGRGDNNGRAGGTGGSALGSAPLGIRGGCPGGPSGEAGPSPEVGPPDTTVSDGGAGGGALQLTARATLNIAGGGRVLAGGAGGAGAPLDTACGGGGGGSGGFVGLEGAMVHVGGIVVANGGAGGASATYGGAGSAGDPGDDAHPDDSVAIGGAGTSCAPAGGNGSTGGDGAMGNENGACGGGGGGGAAGFVIVYSPAYDAAVGAIVSPAVTLNP